MVDVDGEGTVSLEELVMFLNGDLALDIHELLWKLKKQFKVAALNGVDIVTILTHLDTGNTGFISTDQVWIIGSR